MSAVSMQVAPLHHAEAIAYWDELTLECKRHVKEINAVILDNQMPEQYGLEWQNGPLSLFMVRSFYPSTEINVYLTFEHWGPKISGAVRGRQEEDLRFYPEEFEFSIGCDEDESAVAITAEGRSLTPHELAKYLAQNFRRCYPGLSLPSPESPLN